MVKKLIKTTIKTQESIKVNLACRLVELANIKNNKHDRCKTIFTYFVTADEMSDRINDAFLVHRRFEVGEGALPQAIRWL